jgi:diguanylate cyclase (GGDEF)-like protein
MRERSLVLRRWRYVGGVLVPAIASLVIAATAVLGFVLWSAQNIDARSRDRQVELARHVIETQIARLPHEQESVSIWDDALIHTQLAFDSQWVDINLGVWMYDFFGHDEAIILNDRDRPIYAMNAGARVETAVATRELPDLLPLVSALRADIASGAMNAYLQGTDKSPPRKSDLMIVGGAPSIVSVVPIVSDTGDIPQAPGTEYLHVGIIHLDKLYSQRLAGEYMIASPAFSTLARESSSRGFVPLTNSAGRFITFFGWDLANPGRAIVNQTIPVLAGAFLIAGLIVFVLLDQLWRKSRALETGREDAEHQARHDSLTGLANRASFDGDLARTLVSHRSREQSISVMLLDLDRFKQVNDTLGHQAGDDLIQAVGQRLKQVIGPEDRLARLGGDEFGIVHRGSPNLSEPLLLSHRIIEALGKPFELEGGEVFVGTSIGLAIAEHRDVDARELTRRADIALFEAKATGRNRAVVFEEAMSELLRNRHTIEAELREALRQTDQLSVAFQPLFDAHTLKIIGAEALARWHHPKMGHISPAHFIPVAETTGLIEALGDLVLEKACGLGAKWPGLTIAVNISPVQLRNPKFCDRVFAQLRQTGMRPEDLELEITESILLEDARAATEAIRTLRTAGVKIALDDFGTGYSSLNYLKRYPVDRIKIDRSFVSQLSPASTSVAIVEAMVKLAHALKIEVTAEGVETDEQRLLLAALGCNILQGFLLSPPMSRSAVEATLRAGNQPPVAQVA